MKEQKEALIVVARELSRNWHDLPMEICEAWENYENVVPNGQFRDRLRNNKNWREVG